MTARKARRKEEEIVERKDRECLNGIRRIAHHRHDAPARTKGVRVGNAGKVEDRRQQVEMIVEGFGLGGLGIELWIGDDRNLIFWKKMG